MKSPSAQPIYVVAICGSLREGSSTQAALQIALSGDVPERTLKVWGERIRDQITALPGITQVELTNARPDEISIEVPEESLRRYGITFDDVVAAVRRGSLDRPGGSLKTESGEILLRTKGQAYRGNEFGQVVVRTREDGTRLLVADVARVRDGFEEEDRYARFNNAARITMFQPHMHMLGIYQCIEFIYPTQPVRAETVNCAGFDYNWHMNYNYADDVAPLIPAGTILHVSSWFDNSAANRGNVDPSNWVGNGGRTIDEMGFAWIGWHDLTDEEYEAAVAERQAARERTDDD